MEALKNYIVEFLNKIDEKYFTRFSNKQKFYMAIFFAIFSVLLWAFISAGVITHNFNRSLIKSNPLNKNLDVKSMILTESKEGKKSWEIFGETGDYSSDNEIATLNNVIGNFYKNNKVVMSFESSKGTYNEKLKQIDLYEHTYVVLDNDISIVADHITYYEERNLIVGKGHVYINRKGSFIATADEAVVNSDMDIFKIKGHTVTKIYEDKDKNKRGNNG